MKLIRCVLILFTCFIYHESFSQDFWEPLNTPGGLSMFDVEVDSEGRVYLACPGPTGELTGIYRSDDNCNTWVRKVEGMDTTYNPHTRSIAIDNYDNIIVGENSRIYRSDDHGETWTEVYYSPPLAYNFNRAEFGFDSIFLVGGEYDNGIVRSGDNGLSWQVVLDFNDFEPETSEALRGICFASDGVIFACSQTFYAASGSVYISEDYGMTWQVFYNNGYSQFYSIEMGNDGRLIVGGNGIHQYNFETGLWEYENYNFIARDILAVPDSKIFVADSYNGGGFGVVYSADNGQSYEVLNSGMLSPDGRSFAVDLSGRVLVCGSLSNALYRSYDTLVTGIIPDKENVAGSGLVAYPNPFNRHCIIQSPFPEFASLILYDMQGVVVLKSYIKGFGTYNVNANTLSKGMYIAIIQSNNYKRTIKLIHH